jgi:aquaporin Z
MASPKKRPSQSSRPNAAVRAPAAPAPAGPVVLQQAVDPNGIWIKLAAEAFGTFVLVFGGCGAAVFAADFPVKGVQLGIGFLGVALAFGLTVLTMAVAVGNISGGHFNPAVTVGLACARRTPWRDVPGYIAAQIVGGVLAALVLFVIASGRPGFDATTSGFATNGYGTRSPGGFSLGAVILDEVLLTAVFLAVIIAATGSSAPAGLAPVAIGLTLTLIHLISIPVDNTSVNPARSLAVALFAGPAALGQVWVFLIAPTAGGAIAGLLFRAISRAQYGLGGQGAKSLSA